MSSQPESKEPKIRPVQLHVKQSLQTTYFIDQICKCIYHEAFGAKTAIVRTAIDLGAYVYSNPCTFGAPKSTPADTLAAFIAHYHGFCPTESLYGDCIVSFENLPDPKISEKAIYNVTPRHRKLLQIASEHSFAGSLTATLAAEVELCTLVLGNRASHYSGSPVEMLQVLVEKYGGNATPELITQDARIFTLLPDSMD